VSDDPLDLDTGLPARIAADAAVLAPLTLSVARRLSASADADGVMWPDHSALARQLSTDVVGIVSALDQLARRGHLVTAPHRSLHGRVGYRFVAAPADNKLSASRVVPFPRRYARERVRHYAKTMARMSEPNARLYLRRMMRVYAEELRQRGIAEYLIEREVDALSAAIRTALYTAVLTPDEEPA
jgi:uncharacterized protein DUF6074